jgi:hypothetical protein
MRYSSQKLSLFSLGNNVLSAVASNIDGSLGDINVFFNSAEQAYLEQRDSHSIWKTEVAGGISFKN